MGEILHQTGAKESAEKAVEPTQIIEFLGVTFNSITATMEVSPDKLLDIKNITAQWLQKERFNRNQLERLICKIQFVAACVRPGRVFICRMLNVLRNTNRHQTREIPTQLRADIQWWNIYLDSFNGVSMAWMQQYTEVDYILTTDASKKV